MRKSAGVLVAVCALASLSGCERVERVLDVRRDLTPHEAYAAQLASTGLIETALGQDWIRAAQRALASPLRVPLPYREEGWLGADEPGAVGLRLDLKRGQVLTVRTAFDAGDSARVFVDLFRVPEEPDAPFRPVVRVDSLPDGMVYEPYRDGEYVLRLQPELLRGGRYRIELRLDPSLSFPVAGHDEYAIGSGFGAPRDGGIRDHHGVDIFADRGTPALAASAGLVYRVQDTKIGGLVVWIRDDKRDQRLYYAHLSQQLVANGDSVQVGDTVGLVGNTGNARTTPPHLHFGVYARGPQNPIPWLVHPRRRLPSLPAGPERLGGWVRVAAAGAALTAEPEGDASATARSDDTDGSVVPERLPAHTPLRLVAGSADVWRVRLPDGRVGWVRASSVEPAEAPLDRAALPAGGLVRAGPAATAPVMDELAGGASVAVLGEFGAYLWVRDDHGRTGWLLRGDS